MEEVLPWRDPSVTAAFGVSALEPVIPLVRGTSSLEGLLFWSFDGTGTGT